MGGAQDQAARTVEKAVRGPFQWYAAMWAAVFVNKYLLPLADGKQWLALIQDTLAAWVSEFIQAAEWR